MGRILIVAEKPAQAREYASVLGVLGKRQGYLENEDYVITWCVGHLLELERPEVYMDLEKVGKRWSLKRLPVLPEIHTFRRIIKPNTYQQFQVLQKWLKSSEIEQVICGTDADREGQLLFQEVWDLVNCTKPLSRLWISSLTVEAIREGLRNLLPEQKVAGLAAAGYGRAFSDWDFGMNLTEGFTALFGSFDSVRKKPNVISIGRVQTPTLALIVEREWEIEQFVAETFFDIKANFSSLQGEYSGRWFEVQDQEEKDEESKRLTDRQKAEEIIAKTNGQQGKIIHVQQKKVSEPPPLLFDLTSLTITASKRFNFSAEKVLELAQSLYEKKAITYPRTDCAYLPEDMMAKLPSHLKAVRQAPYIESVDEAMKQGVPNGKRVINTITAHHAIIPTTEKIVLDKLPEAERKIYDLIVCRFLAVWFPPAWYQQTEIITEVEQEKFRTKGRILLSSGWKQVYQAEDADSQSNKSNTTATGIKTVKGAKKKRSKDQSEDESIELPPVNQGETVQTRQVNLEEKSTKPPKRFTQGDLLKAMESAGKQIEDEVLRQQMKGKGLGTVATRPAILENLLQRGYIRQEQKSLKPTEKGMELITLIKNKLPQAGLLISAEMTGQLEYDLAKVEKGELTLTDYMREVEEAIRRIIDELRVYEKKYGKTPLALVPSSSTKNSGASKKKKTGASKTNTASTTHSDNEDVKKQANIQAKIKTDKSDVKMDLKEKSNDQQRNDTKASMSENQKKYETFGACPRCGGEVIEGKKGFGCSNWRTGCSFVVWKTPICGKILTPTQIKSLLKKGKTPLIKGFKSKTGKSFAAYLVWDDAANGKLKFEFQTE